MGFFFVLVVWRWYCSLYPLPSCSSSLHVGLPLGGHARVGRGHQQCGEAGM